MTYTLSIADEATRDLVVTALRTAADQRGRVAQGAAVKIAEAKAAKRDVRSQAVKVTDLLAEAGHLNALADELATARDVVVVSVAANGAPVVDGDPVADGESGDPLPLGEPDGTSAAARAMAELAGLESVDVDAAEDPISGATPEDALGSPEEVLP